MKLKIIEFFSVETEHAKLTLVLITMLSGLCYGLLIFIINAAADTVYNDLELEIAFIISYVSLCVVFYIAQNMSLSRSINLATEVIGKIRLRLLNKVRHSELRMIENTGGSSIYLKLTKDINTITQSVPVLITTIEDLMTVIVAYAYIAIVSFEAFITIVLFIGGSILYFYSNYFDIKKGIIEAGMKEAKFFETLKGVLMGFKQIKINYQKNSEIFTDIHKISKESEESKVNGLTIYRNQTVSIYALNLLMYGTLLFVLPLYFDEVRFSILKIFSALLFASGSFEMVFKSVATVAMANAAIDNIRSLEEKLDKYEIIKGDYEDRYTEFNEISLKSVCFDYTDNEGNILFQAGPIDFNIQKGDIIFIVGGNGSGKSTLLKLLTGLYKPKLPGKITIDNVSLTKQIYPAYRELFSVIFTDYYLFKKFYGVENLDKDKLKKFLELMQLQTKTKYKFNELSNIDLSTGQRKRLACIEALLEDKPIYIFDEWTADQDPVFRKFLYDKILQDLKNDGKTVIIVTHDDRYFDYADKLITMEEGRMISFIDNKK